MKKILLVMLCVLTATTVLVGCGKGGEKVSEEKSNVVEVNGKEITLPCTLAELENCGVFIARKSAKQEIVNSENQDFSLIEMTSNSFEEDEILKAMISTGEDHKKKEENCIVTRIINETVASDKFAVGGKIGLGSTIKETTNAFGKKNYELLTEEDDEEKGLSQVHYFGEDGNSGKFFYFQNNECVYVEVFGNIEKPVVDIVD